MLGIKHNLSILPCNVCSSHFNLSVEAGSTWIDQIGFSPLWGLGGSEEGARTTLNGPWSPFPGWLAAQRWWGCDIEFTC